MIEIEEQAINASLLIGVSNVIIQVQGRQDSGRAEA